MRRNKNQLSYQLLESRQLLAGDFMVDPLNITLDSFTDGQVVSILQQGGSSVFYLPDGQWNGVDQPGVEGAGFPIKNCVPPSSGVSLLQPEEPSAVGAFVA